MSVVCYNFYLYATSPKYSPEIQSVFIKISFTRKINKFSTDLCHIIYFLVNGLLLLLKFVNEKMLVWMAMIREVKNRYLSLESAIIEKACQNTWQKKFDL